MAIISDHAMCGLPLEIESEVVCKKYELIIGSFDHIHTLNKVQFISKLMNDMFQLIPEAEKGIYYEPEGTEYLKVCSKGYEKGELNPCLLPVAAVFPGSDSAFSNCIEVKQIFEKTKNSKRFNQENQEIIRLAAAHENHTTLYVEIFAGGSKAGLLCIDNFSGCSFSSLSKRTAKYFAQLIASYLEQRINQERVSQLHVELIQSLISSVEINDPYMEGHGKRVGFYAKRLGDFLGLPSDSARELETTGLLHDIGKISIPSHILTKKDKLVKEEYAVIQKHPVNTKKILEKIKGLNKISEYAYCHHEHYDGNGYPRGLRGSEIPYEAQILSVADAFDAMTSTRAYRKALTASSAAEVILSQSGKQFNPELSRVAAMLLPILHHMMCRGEQETQNFNAELYESFVSR